MSTIDARPLVVGVTGPGHNTAALRFAVDEAGREGCEVALVHAAHQALPPPPPSVLLTYEGLEDVGNQIVKEVAEELEEISGGSVPCTAASRLGGPVDVLVEASREARLVVLQHRDLSRLARIVVASTANAVAAHAQCPVVSVPEHWSPPEQATRVTVGVHEEGAPHQVLDAAFAAAAARGVPLRVVHAWRLDGGYEDLVGATAAEEWRVQQLESLAQVLQQVRVRHPDVPVEPEVRYARPGDVLVEHSAQSDLLVLGRHSHHRPLPDRLGSVARTLIREARCPVMVVPVTSP
jgi:nucleotide-binding universal stress UspA family protein